jgi:cytochrome b
MRFTATIRSIIGLPAQPSAPTQTVQVWDLPIRIFHWSLVVLVGIAWATSEEKGIPFLVHTIAGYAVLAALIFRIIWGFVGSAHARFASFLQPLSVVTSYSKQLLKLQPTRFVGHNPLGGWMIVMLLTTLALIVASGLLAKGGEGMAGPWASGALGLSGRAWYEVHEELFNVLLGLIVIHVAGVIVDQLLTGERLVRAMFTGTKQVAATEQVLEATRMGLLKPVGILIFAVLATGFIVGWQFPASNSQEHARDLHSISEEITPPASR